MSTLRNDKCLRHLDSKNVTESPMIDVITRIFEVLCLNHGYCTDLCPFSSYCVDRCRLSRYCVDIIMST